MVSTFLWNTVLSNKKVLKAPRKTALSVAQRNHQVLRTRNPGVLPADEIARRVAAEAA